MPERPIIELPSEKGVPGVAAVLSLAALAIPVDATAWFPGWTSDGLGTLIWLSALIPAFLLAYYRGLRGVAVALAAVAVTVAGSSVAGATVGRT